MPTPPPVRLDIDPDALPAVTFALQRTIDDPEARAIVVTDRDTDLGPSSAAEYRTDIDRLTGLLGQLGHPSTRPDPERAAVVWLDGTYTIAAGRPARLITTTSLDRLLAQATQRCGRSAPDPPTPGAGGLVGGLDEPAFVLDAASPLAVVLAGLAGGLAGDAWANTRQPQRTTGAPNLPPIAECHPQLPPPRGTSLRVA